MKFKSSTKLTIEGFILRKSKATHKLIRRLRLDNAERIKLIKMKSCCTAA